MDCHIFIALLGALVNLGLSVTVPCMLEKSDQPFVVQVKRVFEMNKQEILASSFIVAITIYLALKIAPSAYPMFSNLTGLNTMSTDYYSGYPAYSSNTRVIDDNEMPPELRNLLQLMKR